MTLTSVEICTGAGGQALGLEQAGFEHAAVVEIDHAACETLRLNRPNWHLIEGDVHNFSGRPFKGIDLLAGGVPCPPFSKAGRQLGASDDRDLFPQAIRLIDECRPGAVMLENVRGFLDAVFEDYRRKLKKQLSKLGYVTDWRLLNASDYGVPQLRPRVVVVALPRAVFKEFRWPDAHPHNPPSVGEVLFDMMGSRGWKGVRKWRQMASEIAPTIVGGSKKHGGPDLGPTRARRAWLDLSVNGSTIAEEPPAADFVGIPRLTVQMVARLQGFPDEWKFFGKKTPAYRQVGNAFPPPVAAAVGTQIRLAQERAKGRQVRSRSKAA
jgi:DNA (cytosine-5)-methyltransferase 1